MDKLKKELKQLKIQIRVGIDQKQISQDWGILLLDNLEEAINYTHSCKSDSELLLCKHCDNKKVLHSEATGLCPDRFKHFEAK